MSANLIHLRTALRGISSNTCISYKLHWKSMSLKSKSLQAVLEVKDCPGIKSIRPIWSLIMQKLFGGGNIKFRRNLVGIKTWTFIWYIFLMVWNFEQIPLFLFVLIRRICNGYSITNVVNIVFSGLA